MGGRRNRSLLHCVLINARSLCNKLPELHQWIYSSHRMIDIMIVTESWLTNQITDSLLDPNCQYNIYRNDRTDCPGGGVCAFISRQLPSIQIDLQIQNATLEMLCFDLPGSSCKYRIFAAYRPTDSSQIYKGIDRVTYMRQITEKIEQFTNNNGPTIVLGDLNCPDIDWDTMSTLSNEVQRNMCDFCMSNSYVQCVNEPTREDHILDVVLTNEPSIVTRISTDSPFSTSDHNTVEFDLFFKATSRTDLSQTIRKYLWKKADYNALNSYLYNYRWINSFPSTSLQIIYGMLLLRC